MIEPLSILVIIVASLWVGLLVKLMTGLLVFSCLCVICFGVALAWGVTE